jgi:hypothetical protein
MLRNPGDTAPNPEEDWFEIQAPPPTPAAPTPTPAASTPPTPELANQDLERVAGGKPDMTADASGRRSGRAYLLAMIGEMAKMPGANPSLARDPEYWLKRITETGGLGADNLAYWRGMAMRPEGAPEGGGSGAPGTLPPGLSDGSLLTPWTKVFDPGAAATPPPAFSFGKYVMPTEVTEQNDPGFQSRLKLGQQALERSAAARGTLLTGGTAKALEMFGQDFASNEFSAVNDRAFQKYSSDKGLALDEYGSKYGLANDAYSRARDAYGLERENFQNNQDRPYDKLFRLSNLGAQTATGLNGTNTALSGQYAGSLSDLYRVLFGQGR